MTNHNTHYPYLIIGGGLSGKIMALGLASHGIKCAILDRAPQVHFNDTRTIALNSKTVGVLKAYNLFDHLSDYISNINDIYVVDDRNDLHMLHFSEKHNNSQPIGHMILSSDFNKQLSHLINESEDITAIEASYDDVETDGKIASVFLTNGEVITANMLIAADGMRSKIRGKFCEQNIAKQYDQAALTFIVEHEKEHHGMAMEHFMPAGPFATLPLRDPNKSSIVWCDKMEALQHYITLPREELSIHLKERVGEVLGNIYPIDDLSTSHCFPLSANVTKQYYYKNIVLIADAAHNVHPLAGQGLNQGIKDISSLVTLIDDMHFCGLSTYSNMLSRYEKERSLDNLAMYQITDKLLWLFSNNVPVASMLRKTGLSLLDSITPMKSLMLKYAKGN